jgi:hypothetical protein
MNMANFRRPFHSLMANAEVSKAVFSLIRHGFAITSRDSGKAMFATTLRADLALGTAEEEEALISAVSNMRPT